MNRFFWPPTKLLMTTTCGLSERVSLPLPVPVGTSDDGNGLPPFGGASVAGTGRFRSSSMFSMGVTPAIGSTLKNQP